MSNSALVFALSALKKANTANERIDALPLPMVKSFTYTGNGNTPAVITFPEVPTTILSIEGQSGGSYLKSDTIEWGVSQRALCTVLNATYGATTYSVNLSFDDDNKQLTIDGSTETRAFNTLDREFTVFYI